MSEQMAKHTRKASHKAHKSAKAHRKVSHKAHHKVSHKARKATHKKRRISKGASSWNKKVMEVYREMKRKDPNVKLGDAMKEASRRK